MKVTPSKYKPFMLVNEDNNVKIVAGNVQVTPETFPNEEAAEKYLTEQPYEMFINLYSIFQYYEKKEKSTKTEETTKSN